MVTLVTLALQAIIAMEALNRPAPQVIIALSAPHQGLLVLRVSVAHQAQTSQLFATRPLVITLARELPLVQADQAPITYHRPNKVKEDLARPHR